MPYCSAAPRLLWCRRNAVTFVLALNRANVVAVNTILVWRLSKTGRKVALCPIQGVGGPPIPNAPTLYLSGTRDSNDSGWRYNRNSEGIKMFSQIKGASMTNWVFNANARHYGGACAMWYDCYLKSESGACSLARGGKFFEDLSGIWTAPQFK